MAQGVSCKADNCSADNILQAFPGTRKYIPCSWQTAVSPYSMQVETSVPPRFFKLSF
jgi:hypothetical protein